MNYLYLHGFASGPQSKKAKYICDRIQSLGLHLQVPDLNQDDFLHLTLSRQIEQVHHILNAASEPWTIIGSSFGGLTAAWVAQQQPAVQQLVLLAPAFGFLKHYWLPILGETQQQQWQATGTLEVYHYGTQQTLPLRYQFLEDLSTYSDDELQRPVPTLILHGTEDATIPIAASEQYVAQRSWVKLKRLKSDHAMTNVLAQLWTEMQASLKSDEELLS